MKWFTKNSRLPVPPRFGTQVIAAGEANANGVSSSAMRSGCSAPVRRAVLTPVGRLLPRLLS
jgi:hypothetical protein